MFRKLIHIVKAKTLHEKNLTETKWFLVIFAFFFLVSLLAMGILITNNTLNDFF